MELGQPLGVLLVTRDRSQTERIALFVKNQLIGRVIGLRVLDPNAGEEGCVGAENELTHAVSGQGVLGRVEVRQILLEELLLFEQSARQQIPHQGGILKRHQLRPVNTAEERRLGHPVVQEGHHVEVVFRLPGIGFVELILGLEPGLGAELPETAVARALVEALCEVEGADDVLLDRLFPLGFDLVEPELGRILVQRNGLDVVGIDTAGADVGGEFHVLLNEARGDLVRGLLRDLFHIRW